MLNHSGETLYQMEIENKVEYIIQCNFPKYPDIWTRMGDKLKNEETARDHLAYIMTNEPYRSENCSFRILKTTFSTRLVTEKVCVQS